MISYLGIKYNRISAYLLDMLLVAFLAVMLANNTITNPYYTKYSDAYENYTKASNEVINNLYDNNIEYKDIELILSKPVKEYEKSNLFLYIWFLLLYYLYFVLFTYYNKGATLGKKIFKIKVVNKNKETVSIKSLLIRSLLYGESIVFFGAPIIIFLKIILNIFNINTNIYFYAYIILSMLTLILTVIELITFLKGNALHDKLANTDVISV